MNYPIVVEFPVHWGEMDAFGHVNNTRFFVWCESARIALFDRARVPSDPRAGVAPILATAECRFLKPVAYPALVRAGARVASVGNTSFKIEYGILRGDELVAEGSSVVVMVDYRTGAKVPIGDPLRAELLKLHPAS